MPAAFNPRLEGLVLVGDAEVCGARIVKSYGLALAAPFRSLSESLRRRNFTHHYAPLIHTIGRHRDTLKGKRVIVFFQQFLWHDVLQLSVRAGCKHA